MLDPRLAVSTEDSQAAQTTAAPQCVLQGEDGVGWDPHLMPGTEGRQAAGTPPPHAEQVPPRAAETAHGRLPPPPPWRLS